VENRSLQKGLTGYNRRYEIVSKVGKLFEILERLRLINYSIEL